MISVLRPSVLLALVSIAYLVTEGEAICCPWVMTTVGEVIFIIHVSGEFHVDLILSLLLTGREVRLRRRLPGAPVGVLLRGHLQRLLLQLRRALQEEQPQRDRGRRRDRGQSDRQALRPAHPRRLGNSCGETIRLSFRITVFLWRVHATKHETFLELGVQYIQG